MNYTCILRILAASCFVFTDGYSSVRKTAEAVTVGLLATDTKIYEDITGKPLQNWQELAAVFDDLNLSRIDIKLSSGEKFTDVYSIVPHAEGVKFPDGVLMYVRYKPTDWPDIWSEGPKDQDPRARPIRYLIYKDSRGDINSEWWYEEKVQAMLAKTGLTIPPPRPYVPSPSAPTQVVSVKAPLSEAVAVKTETTPSAKPDGHFTTSPSVAEPKTPKNPAWWIIGLILLLIGAAFFLRKQNPKL